MRKPCQRCGADKGQGQGSRICNRCRTESAGKCSRCGAPKPPGQGRRLCDACKPVYKNRNEVRPCVKCGGYEPKGIGHRFCPECEVIEKEATLARDKARRALKRKPCFRCGRPKGPGKRKKLCDRCHAELHSVARVCRTCGVKTILGKYKKTCELCRMKARERQREQQRSREQARRLSERERQLRRVQSRKYDRQKRAQKLENQRMRYHLAQGGIKRHIAREVAKSDEKLWRLPALPLAHALEEIIRKETIGNPYSELPDDPAFGHIEVVCERVGISSRALRRWLTGECKEVQWDRADAILTHTDLSWWDVWNEDTVDDPAVLARVTGLFEGTELVA